MSNAKHTAGLLVVKDTDDGIVYRVITKESAVVMAETQSEHFARLIAAAPELLSNLQFAVDLLTPIAGHTVQVERMRAAIAKAQGGAQ